MKINFNKFQSLFLGMYIFFNTYALLFILNTQKTFGDFFESAPHENLVLLAYIYTIVPFIFFGWFLYPYFENKLKKTLDIDNIQIENKLAIFVLILQVSFMVFNLLTGVNSAGSGIKTDSVIKYLFILFSPDTFFIILYGFARENKYFKYNLLIYLISSVQRGWMGGIFFIAIMELYIYYKKYGFSKKIIFIASSVISFLVLLLPYIVMLKWAARAYFGGLTNDFNNELTLILNLGNMSYTESLGESFSYLFGRFQVLSNVYLFLEHLDTLQVARDNSEYISAFAVGLPQMLLYKVFGLDYTVLTSYYISVIDTKVVLDELTSNTHVGYIGWILAEPYMFWIFLFYTIGLVYLSAYLSSKIGGKYLHFVSWYLLIAYLMHGWIQAYFSYILGLLTFYIVKILIQKIKFKKLENKK
jgi:hypothetical protein